MRSIEPNLRPAGAEAVEFGAALRQTRLSHGREIADVAAALRIRQVYLEAIEGGRFDSLPGPTYAIGFIRAYADYLGLDEAEVVKRYKELRGNVNAQATLVPPAPVATEGRLPTGSVLLLAAVLAAAAYGGWYYLTMKGHDLGDVVAALPDRIAQMVGMKPASPLPAAVPVDSGFVAVVPAAAPDSAATPVATMELPAAATVSTASTSPGSPSPGELVGPTPADSGIAAAPTASAVSAETEPPSPGETSPSATATMPVAQPPASPAATGTKAPTASALASAAPAPPPVPEPAAKQAKADEAGTGRILLKATASSWVEIRDAGGHRVFSQLMRPGESFPVPATPGLMLTTGNAGGLAIVVDGKTLPPLGEQGDVRRDIALDADALLRSARGAQ